MISRKHRKISAKIKNLKDGINSSHNTIPLLDTLKAIEHGSIDEKEFFHILTNLSISHRNNEIRYIAVKLLYENFPEESTDLLAKLLLNDLNYNFRVINFSNKKRYNFNDIINWGIEKRHNRELMIKNIMNSDLMRFALSWKDYRDTFDIRYDINLNWFILTVKATNETAYICKRLTDPFQEKSILLVENYSEMTHLNTLQTIAELFKELLTEKEAEFRDIETFFNALASKERLIMMLINA